LTPAVLATVGVLAGLLICSAAPAFAQTGYGLAFSFASPEGFTGPVGLAVDDSGGVGDPSKGDVYVVNQGANAVDEFEADGVFLAGVEVAGAQPNQLTVDDYPANEGAVYVAGYANGTIYRLAPGLTAVQEVKTGLANPTGVAVDAAGDFFVSLGGSEVLEFNGKWEPVNAAGTVVGATENAVVTGLNGTQTVAAEAAGDLYVATGSGTIEFALVGGEYEAGVTLDPEGSLGVTLAPSGNVFDDRGGEVAEYEPPSLAHPNGVLLRDKIGFGVFTTAVGVGVSASGAVYVADHANDLAYQFEEGATPQAPMTEAAEEITGTTATLTGELEPPTTELKYYFEYNTGSSCTGGSKTPVKEGEGQVSEELTGLEPSAEYTYCFVAENKYGSTPGSPETFKTFAAPPRVDGETSSSVTPAEATLEAQVNPNNQKTSGSLQYSTSAAVNGSGSLIGAAQIASSDLGEAYGDQPIGPVVLTGLTADQIYYYQAVATNATGTTYGTVRSFTTQGAPLVSTGEAENITRTTATLSGAVNPTGVETSYHFAYISEAGYQTALAKGSGGDPYSEGETTAPLNSSSDEPVAVAPTPASGLLPGETYHYALVSENEFGIRYGEDHTFTTLPGTPPIVSTGGVSGVSQNSATLSGTVSTNSLQTEYGFEIETEPGEHYGPATGLGSLGGAATETVTLTLGRLQPGTTYYYRVTATNADGTSQGEAETFTTPGFPTLIAPPASPPLVATPAIAFPTETGTTTTTTSTAKPLTKAQKLTKALKACKKDKKNKRTACEKQARKRFQPAKQKKHKQ
jgi:hypothetical protein